MPDERLFQTVRKGVPGTEMPPSTLPDDDVLMIIAYLRDMGGAAPAEAVRATSTTADACLPLSAPPATVSARAAGGWVPISRASAWRDRARR